MQMYLRDQSQTLWEEFAKFLSIIDGEYCSNKKGRRTTIASLKPHSHVKFLSHERPFLQPNSSLNFPHVEIEFLA